MWVVLNCLQPNQAYGSLHPSQDNISGRMSGHHPRHSASTITGGYPSHHASHHGGQNQLQINQQLSGQQQAGVNQSGQLALNNSLLNLNNLTQATAQS
jgi:hypothetical protein